ncbi:hypothetical protein SAMN05216278_3359 [Halopelagius longus]|uniref:Uncharacterized protein n=1 Tax=Halopelagius longus TaxID=1236180 RepID=A0A1H1FQN6_9EURY|nr:hypothetical protein SAMN05216278_3359 [Halopelagius longus]
MNVPVETKAEESLRSVTPDSRGRITSGSNYAGETVSVAIVDHGSDSAETDGGSND